MRGSMGWSFRIEVRGLGCGRSKDTSRIDTCNIMAYKQRMYTKPDITSADLKQWFSYDPETGDLCWLKKPANNVKVGVPVRAKNTSGYYHVGFRRKVYVVHRLIWLMEYDEWPEAEIDHINCTKTDNRLENLRLATKSQNLANTPKRDGATSRYKGVCWKKSNNCWTAQISHDGKCHWLGHFQTEEEAHQAYCDAVTRLKGEFARYE